MPSVAQRLALWLAAISMAALGLYLVARGIGTGGIMLWGGGGIVLIVAVVCLYFAAVPGDE